jgi:hemerythrin-like domain-containing protein
MNTTRELQTEHKAVLVALDLLEKVEGALAARKKQAPDHLEQLLAFFRGFVDACHHAKEESVLFPELERHGAQREAGPIGVMLEEHDAGRRHVREMAEALARFRQGDGGSLLVIRRSADAYRDLLRRHIEKEEQVLFPMAESMLPPDEAAGVIARFGEIEREQGGEGRHEAYHAMLERLKGIYGS